MRADVLVLDDPAQATAERLVAAAGNGAHIALTGGSTPRTAYERAAEMDGDWSGTTLWWGDERCVGPDDERSNYGMARSALLERLGGPAPTVRRIPGELGPQAGAEAYERELREAFAGVPPALDLVLLGLGPDGHVASLFPHQPTLAERERLAVAVPEAALEPFVPRVSLTLRVINAARAVVFLVAGEEKADAVARAFGGEPDPGTPASLVSPVEGLLQVLLDPPAASRLEGRGR